MSWHIATRSGREDEESLVWKAAFLFDLFRDSTLYDSHEDNYVWVTQRACPLLLLLLVFFFLPT